MATAGLKMASPLPTTRIESTISSSSASLRTYPRAPARKAMNTESSSSNSVTTRTRTFGLSCRILRVASMPLTSGFREAQVVEGWGPEVVNQTPDVGDGTAELLA